MSFLERVWNDDSRQYEDVHSRMWIANAIWNMKTADGEEFLFSNQERLQLTNTRLPEWDCKERNWNKWCHGVLQEMDRVDDVTYLLPLWKTALVHHDVDFAKMVLSKLE